MPLQQQTRKLLEKIFFDPQVLDLSLRLPALQSLVARPGIMKMSAPEGTVAQEIVLSTVKQYILQEEVDHDQR